jgi:enoyl-[acyl-carrier-protein] reductase (NADH)
MTSLNLSDEQKMQIKGATQFNRLATLEDVSNAVYSMNSFLNTGITGNFTIVDLGFSRVKNI